MRGGIACECMSIRSHRRPWRRSQTLSARRPGCLKPLSPLHACACGGLKPPSPLRVRNGRFWCSFRMQWRCRFQRSLVGGVQWCRRFHAGLHQWLQRCHWLQSRHGRGPVREKVLPAWSDGGGERDKVRPAHEKWHKIGVSWRAGRVFRGNAGGGAVLGEVFRTNRCCAKDL